MVGSRREGVTISMSKLKGSGLIKYSRGKVTITDRQVLEVVACECYQIVKDKFARLYERADESIAS